MIVEHMLHSLDSISGQQNCLFWYIILGAQLITLSEHLPCLVYRSVTHIVDKTQNDGLLLQKWFPSIPQRARSTSQLDSLNRQRPGTRSLAISLRLAPSPRHHSSSSTVAPEPDMSICFLLWIYILNTRFPASSTTSSAVAILHACASWTVTRAFGPRICSSAS